MEVEADENKVNLKSNEKSQLEEDIQKQSDSLTETAKLLDKKAENIF